MPILHFMKKFYIALI